MKKLPMIVIATSMVVVIFTCRIEPVYALLATGEPTNLGNIVNSSSDERGVTISSDNLTIIFCSNRSGGRGGYDLWISTRKTVIDPWGTPANMGSYINTGAEEMFPCLSEDSLTLYFSDYYATGSTIRPGGQGQADIWVARRASTHDAFGYAVNVGFPVNSGSVDVMPSISSDGLVLYFTSDRPGSSGRFDNWMATRPTIDSSWYEPVNLGSNLIA